MVHTINDVRQDGDGDRALVGFLIIGISSGVVGILMGLAACWVW